MTSYRDLVAAAKTQITELDAETVLDRLETVVLVDVREVDENQQGTIAGSHLVPRGLLERDIRSVAPDLTKPIVVYCAAGNRSALAAQSLQMMGYTDVASLQGGFDQWKTSGLPWEAHAGMTTDQRTRYSRHLLLPEVGERGQEQLLNSKVLLIGAGGLSSPVALYLAAAGVGTIGIIDDDNVDTTNLQRQVLHNLDRLGMPKVVSARIAITSLNPDISVITHHARLTADNAMDVMSGFDVVVDGGDNFPTRYLVNDAALHLGIPVVHGSIFRFEGQVSVFQPYEGPCYRCLFPQAPPPELAPSCAEAGVLGVLPGIIGSIQAMETIKLLLGLGESLVGKILMYDALEEDFTKLTIARDPECLACSDPEQPPELVDYDWSCLPSGATTA